MRQVAKKSFITVAAASGMLAMAGTYAHADAGADAGAANSPGVGSGNTIQAPVHIPANVCGNTVGIVGVLNPAFGNTCANVSGGGRTAGSGATARGGNSPGVASGNSVQVPVDLPVNACGNSVDAGAGLNPATGNTCANVSGGRPSRPAQPQTPGTPQTPEDPDNPADPADPSSPEQPAGDPGTSPQTVTPEGGTEELAQTGSSGMLGVALPMSAALLLGGAVLYRRAQATSRP